MLALSEAGGRIQHVLALVQEAIGEKTETRQRRTALHLLIGVLRNQEGGSNRFVPPPIE